MKTVEISTASGPLAKYADGLDDFVVLTSNSKPVAAIVSLRNVDPESLALTTNAEFMEIIAEVRCECARGDTISLGAMKKEFAPECLLFRRFYEATQLLTLGDFSPSARLFL